MAVLKLLLASNNAHKVVEFRRLFERLPLELVTPRDIGLEMDVDETGETFEANARLKAHAFAAASGLPSLADDSGIEVDALDGRPGVYSARYRVVLVLADPAGDEQATVGRCEGRVGYAPSGANGFGYDPVFFVPAFGKTIAELDPAQKDAISHRGEAARAMADVLAGRVR